MSDRLDIDAARLNIGRWVIYRGGHGHRPLTVA